ncbi:unnamed protein product [Thelazia callipaeda]|uniref:Pericentrin/AKAP-450 centrosomal targeting domain-containing protein n=1 Tax=Thelazia callipaeda TaxID=103827 RepID=A0A0N5CYG2_THECL|nr:unnamed protein product [Thelazia callipaeda]
MDGNVTDIDSSNDFNKKSISLKKFNDSVKKHEELLRTSKDVLHKLNEIRRNKALEMKKYETVVRMDALSVSGYLQQQHLKLQELIRTDESFNKYNEERMQQAAITIQRFFRKIIYRKQILRTLCTWKWVAVEKRIKYIEIIAERMSSNATVPRRIDLSIIKNKVNTFIFHNDSLASQ